MVTAYGIQQYNNVQMHGIYVPVLLVLLFHRLINRIFLHTSCSADQKNQGKQQELGDSHLALSDWKLHDQLLNYSMLIYKSVTNRKPYTLPQ